MITIIVAILVFSIVIFIHEFGHFIAAKKSGVKVNEFSVGMGPAIFKKQRGETLYAVRVLPIGGYCAMEGEDEASDDSRSFDKVSTFRRFIIIVAGALMNFLFALLICVFIQSFTVSTVNIENISENSAAERSGFQVGDVIEEVNGTKITNSSQIQSIILESKGEALEYTVQRKGGTEKITAGAEPAKGTDGKDVFQLGITMQTQQDSSITNFSISRGVVGGFAQFGAMMIMMGQVLGMLFTGQLGISNLAGPVGVVTEIGRQANTGLISLLFFVAYINVNLGVLNLLPFPALDGGRAVLILIEMITGKKLPKDKEALINGLGLVLLLGLILFVSINDIRRIF